MVSKNTPGLLDLQNLASEHSCVAAAAQVAEMLAGIRAGGVPAGCCELPDAETGEVLPRGSRSGLREARPPRTHTQQLEEGG